MPGNKVKDIHDSYLVYMYVSVIYNACVNTFHCRYYACTSVAGIT